MYSTMMVIMMAITPSVNASRRCLPIALLLNSESNRACGRNLSDHDAAFSGSHGTRSVPHNIFVTILCKWWGTLVNVGGIATIHESASRTTKDAAPQHC